VTRVLYAPRNIAGQATEYAAAVRPLGFAAEVWSYGDPAFDFGADRVLDRERLLTDPRHRWDVVDEAVRRFDVFHFQYGRSLLDPQAPGLPDLWDLPLLKSLGKRVVMHFRGSDVRLRSVHLAREPHSYFRLADAPCDEPRIAARIAVCRRYCDRMFVSTPGLLDYVPDATWVPHVVDATALATPRGPEPAVPVVVHVPSSRATKGSDVVDPALRGLDGEGVIRYRPLSGLSRAGLLAALRSADVVVDSLTIGDHGLTAVEAMATGAVAVAHVHPRNRDRNPGVPVVEATVEDLAEVVRGLAGDPARRAALRELGRAWVAARHDRPVVGALLAEAYRAPPTRPALGPIDWPRSDAQRRVAELEAEVERLRRDVDPLTEGVGLLTRTAPRFAVERLLARVAQLEAALAVHEPSSPLLRRGGRALAGPARGVREVLREHPALHRLARSAARRARRLRT